MEKFKLFRILWLLIISFSIVVNIKAQPTSKKISEQEGLSKKATAQSVSQSADKTKTEQEYLAKARQNIEQFRKGNALVSVIDSKGRPVRNVKVEINQVSQDFLFGNIVFELAGTSSKEPYKVDEFKAKFKALFNFAIIPYYWAAYERKAGNPDWQRNEAAIKWCLDNNITLK